MKPVKNNLVALGSAAVLTVYSAGFLRTRAAADRWLGDEAGRSRAVAMVPHDPGPAQLPASLAPDSAHDVPAGSELAAAPPRPIKRATRDTAPAATVPDSVTPPPAKRDSVTAPQVIVPVTAPVATQGVAVDSQSTDSVAKAAAQFKDGLYSGWGSSRHGDIQASIEIRDGRIVAASITQCLTHYSCSWISALPAQVIARQSANVDFISVATQSANAFYYAIVEALAKAK